MPLHGFRGNVRYGVQDTPGEKVLTAARLDMPDFIRRVHQDTPRQYHEVTGVGSGYLQTQQLLMHEPVIEIEHDVCSPTFLANCIRAAGEVLPLLTIEVDYGQLVSDPASVWVDCMCASMRLSAARREPLRATSTWWPLTEEVETGVVWAAPSTYPFTFAMGICDLGGEIIGFDIDLDNGLVRDQYISVAPPADPFAPSYVLVGRQAITARIRGLSAYVITEIDPVVDVTLVFDNGTTDLTIVLSHGAFHGQEHEMTGDAAQEFGVPMTFDAIAIT